MRRSGLIIAALRGGSGKTMISVGVTAALKNSGKFVAPFKKGPDYIDAGWLALAAGRPCSNLDPFLMEPHTILRSFASHSENSHISIVEGNRGLFDGMDSVGTTSTAELAKLLKLPVILIIDCTKCTLTVAALVAGCADFDKDVNIKGVILNRIAGKRHQSVIREGIEKHTNIPVIGAIPRMKESAFPERHMGLVPTVEHFWAKESLDRAADIASKYLDLDALYEFSQDTGELDEACLHDTPATVSDDQTHEGPAQRVRIGVMRDSCFQFYYPENLAALEENGAELVFTSPFSDENVPDVDALYIGGGFPETHAAQIARNETYNSQIKSLAQKGLPIYAECGGLMYLGEELVLDGVHYPMAGVIPAVYGFSEKPQGHGYTVVTAEKENPYFAVNEELRGHEFHYSSVLEWKGTSDMLVFRMDRGTGFMNKRDGILVNNVFASYTHLHALGSTTWAASFVKRAVEYAQKG